MGQWQGLTGWSQGAVGRRQVWSPKTTKIVPVFVALANDLLLAWWQSDGVLQSQTEFSKLLLNNQDLAWGYERSKTRHKKHASHALASTHSAFRV
jgi:hypothetical protein